MSEFLEILKSYIYPELVVLIPVLYFIGWGFKKSERVPDKNIPLLLGLVGIVLASLYMVSIATTITVNSVFAAVFAAIVQGLLCSAGAVFANQVKKQAEKSE